MYTSQVIYAKGLYNMSFFELVGREQRGRLTKIWAVTILDTLLFNCTN